VPASGLPGSTASSTVGDVVSCVPVLSCGHACMVVVAWCMGAAGSSSSTHASEQEAAGRGRVRLGSRWGAAWALAPPALVDAALFVGGQVLAWGHATAHSAASGQHLCSGRSGAR